MINTKELNIDEIEEVSGGISSSKQIETLGKMLSFFEEELKKENNPIERAKIEEKIRRLKAKIDNLLK